MQPLDLARRRDLGALLATAFTVWWRHLPVFLTLAFLVIAPLTLVVDGVWLGQLADPDDTGPIVPLIASYVVSMLVVPTIVTAMHVTAVLDLGRGRKPHVGRSTAAALRVFPAVVVVVLIYTVTVAVGFVFLIVPGFWLSVLLYFGAQAAVVDGERGFGALRRSWDLVDGMWWRTFGILALFVLIASVISGLTGTLFQVAGVLTDNGPLYVGGTVASNTITQSFVALAATLLFFDLRASKEPARRGARADAFGTHPERPTPEPDPA